MGCAQSGSYLAGLGDDPVGARKVSKNSRGAMKQGRTRTAVPRRGRGAKWALEPRFEERAVAALQDADASFQVAADSRNGIHPVMVPSTLDPAGSSPEAKAGLSLPSPQMDIIVERPMSPAVDTSIRTVHERSTLIGRSALTPAAPLQGKVKGKEPMLNPTKLGTVRSWIDATDEEDLVDPNDPVEHDAMMKVRRAQRTTEDEGVFDDF